MTALSDSFQGRLVLITGGSSGLGLALANLLAAQGANVWLIARRKDVLESAYKGLHSATGQKHGMISADVADWGQAQSAAARVTREAGVPDLIINCAGSSHPGYVQEIPVDVFHQMMDVDYFGTVNMVKAFLPGMLERGSGHIVNISSISGFLAPFGYSAYAPAKFAVRGFSDVLRLELKSLGVRVSVAFPPDMDTPGMVNENKTKPYETIEAFSTKLVQAEPVAKEILNGIKRGRYIILPGLETKIYYYSMFLVGNAIYPVLDGMVAQARKKKNKNK
jgi:3-dehydrosphinganine reductase